MAISLIREPSEISFSRNPIIYELRTNALISSPGRKYVGNMTLSSLSGITTSSQLTLNFLGKAFVFVFRAAPDESGLQLPLPTGGETISAYVVRLANALRENYYISKHYILTNGTNAITFTAREVGIDYNISSTATPSGMTVGMSISGLTETRNPNLQILVELYSGKKGLIISAALLPDDTGLVRWDISPALTASLLADGHDRPSVHVPVMEKGKTSDSYYIKYTELYGDVQMARKVYTSAQRYVIYGGFAKSVLAERTVLGYLQDGAKSKFLNTLFGNEKVIKYEQPSFLYWVNLGALIGSLQVEVKLYYSDSSEDTYIARSLANVAKYDKVIIPSGVTQLNAHLRDDEKVIVEYDVVLKSGSTEVSPRVRHIINYKQEPYARFFLYENSLGAYESIYVHGKKSIGYDLESTVAKLMSVKDFVLADGEDIEFDLTLRESETVNTGFKPKREIRALRDFFLSPEKYAYKKGVLFPISLTSKSIKEFEDGQNLYSLSFDVGCKYVEELFGGEDAEEEYSYAPNLQAYVPVPPEVPEVNYDDRYYLKTETYNKAEIDSRLTILQSAFDTLETHVNDELTTVIGLLGGKSDIGHTHSEFATVGDLYDALYQVAIFAGDWVQQDAEPEDPEDEADEGYGLGQVVIHDDKLWQSLIDENFEEPGAGDDWKLLLSGLRLGETADTAHRGDHGKAAYEHSLEEGNPHQTRYKDLLDIPEPPGFNFNIYNAIDGDMSQPLFEFPLGAWNSTIREIGNVLKDDNGDLYWTYSGYEGSYGISDQPYIGALKSIDNGKTWSDLGKITEQGFEDPYLIKKGGNFMLYSEAKSVFHADRHLGINLHSGVDITSLTNTGIVVENGAAGLWDSLDRSSPVVVEINGLVYMFFEGRATSPYANQGAIGVATSVDGVSWTVSEHPIIIGYQYNRLDEMSTDTYRLPWVSHLVPDDIINIGDKYMLSAHAYNGRYFATILLFSTDLIHWKDEKGTWINYSLNNTEYGGNGISFYKNEEDNSLNVFFIQRSEGTFKLYKGSFYNRQGSISTDYAVLGNQNSAYKIVGAQRDEILVYNNTLNSDKIVKIGYDINCAIGISKTLINSSSYNITIQGDPDVSLNGVTEGSYIIRPKSTIKIIAVGVNVWAVQFQEITLQENGNWRVEAPLEISKQLPSTTSNTFEGAHIKARVGSNPASSVGVTSIALPTSAQDNYGVTINALRYGTSASPALSIRMHNNSSPGVEVMRVLEDGRANLPGSLGIGLGFTPPTEKLEIGGNVKAEGFKLSALNSAPTSSTDIGTTGEIRITATHIYVCVATNTWVRSELATW